MPPKRMSDILQSSSIDTRISSPLPTIPPASEGPTLPLIDVPSTHGTKRKRAQAEPTASKTMQPHAHTNHPRLYEPWTLLPDKQRKDVDVEAGVEVIVYSKNQNVRAGIRRLVRCVGARRDGAEVERGGEVEEESGGRVDNEGEVVVVSAQGEGTVKLVGIVDMVRRIVAEGSKDRGGEEVKWYLYTVLSSVDVPRTRKVASSVNADGQDGGGEAGDEADVMDVDDEDRAVRDPQQAATKETKKAPVLSVWITKRRMAGWKEVFGEQEMVVCKAVG